MATVTRIKPKTGAGTFSFELALSGIADLTEELENALFEAGCDDATLVLRSGHAFLLFDREADSHLSAMVSAITQVESIDMGIQVVEVHPPDGGAIETVNGLLNLMRSGSHGAKQAWKALKVEAQVKTKSHRHKK